MYNFERFPGKEHKIGDGLTGSVVEVALDAVPSGRVRKYERIAFRDDITAATKVALLVRSGGEDYRMHEVNAPTINLLQEDDFPITVAEGERVVASFTGSVTGDTLDVWASYCEYPLTGWRSGPYDHVDRPA